MNRFGCRQSLRIRTSWVFAKLILAVCLGAALSRLPHPGTARAETPFNNVWIRQLGTSNPDRANSVSADAFGNIYISGYTLGSLGGTNVGNDDAFVSKFDKTGNLLWTKQYGTKSYDQSNGVSVDGLGNVYVSGSTLTTQSTSKGSVDSFVNKYDSSGNLAWSKILGTSVVDASYGVSADKLGNVYITGYTEGALGGASKGSDDAFVSKYDSAGNLAWTKQIGTSSSDWGLGVSADGLGNVYITGHADGSLGGMNVGSVDAFVSKYNSAGTLLWTKTIGSIESEVGQSVTADGLGNVYISGYTTGSLVGPNQGAGDAFVSKLDGAGNIVWTKQMGTSADDTSYGVTSDGLGNVYISGFTSGSLGGPNQGDPDAFLTKFDAAGNLTWSKQLGTDRFDISNGVSADGRGNVYIAGYTQGALQGANKGLDDAFVARYSSALAVTGGTFTVSGNNALIIDQSVGGAEPTRVFDGVAITAQGVGVGVGTQGNLLVLSGGSKLEYTGDSSPLATYGTATLGRGQGMIGINPGALGTVLVQDTGSSWSVNQGLFVGVNGEGVLRIENGGSVTLNNGGIAANNHVYVGYNPGSTSTLIVSGSGSSLNASTGQLDVGFQASGALTIAAGGQVTALRTVVATNSGSNGTLTVTGAGSKLISNEVAVGANGPGRLNVEAGATIQANQGVSIAAQGTLAGHAGTIVGNVQNAGLLSPGYSPGIMTINGDLNSTGTLRLEIAGATDYDRLITSGQLTLGGTIEVDLLNSYQPAIGISFNLLDFGTLAANGYVFDFSGAALPTGYVWDTSNFATAGTLAITAIPEPSVWVMGSVGAFGFTLLGKRMRRKQSSVQA